MTWIYQPAQAQQRRDVQMPQLHASLRKRVAFLLSARSLAPEQKMTRQPMALVACAALPTPVPIRMYNTTESQQVVALGSFRFQDGACVPPPRNFSAICDHLDFLPTRLCAIYLEHSVLRSLFPPSPDPTPPAE